MSVGGLARSRVFPCGCRMMSSGALLDEAFSFSDASKQPGYIPSQSVLPQDYSSECPRQLGKVFALPVEESNALFAGGRLLPKALRWEASRLGQLGVLVREPMLELDYFMHTADYSKHPLRLVLWGPSGSGKSLCLLHAILMAQRRDFLVLPLTTTRSIIARRGHSPLLKSDEDGDEFYQQPAVGAYWLQNLVSTPSATKFLPELTTTKEYQWGYEDAIPAQQPLLRLCKFGIEKPRFSCRVVSSLLNELKGHATRGLVKLAVVMDGVNLLFGQSQLISSDRKKVPFEQVELIRAFKDLLSLDYSNGILLSSVQCTGNRRRSDQVVTPRSQLGEAGFDAMTPFLPVHVPNLTRQQVMTILAHYINRKWIHPAYKVCTQDAVTEVMTLTDGNPRRLQLLCNYI